MPWTADQPDRRGAGDKVSWKAYVDSILEERHDQMKTALHAHDLRVKMNHDDIDKQFKLVQEQLDRRINDQKHNDELAAKERHKTAETLHSSQARFEDQANRERDKAALALQTASAMSFTEGIERLREHILNQGLQFEAALEAVEGRAQLRHDGIEREFLLRQKASDAAVQKAEDAQKEVNERGNGFRDQLKEQNAMTMPRTEIEKEVSALSERLRILEFAQQNQVGINQANIRSEDRSQPWHIWVAGTLIILFVLVMNIIVGIGAFT